MDDLTKMCSDHRTSTVGEDQPELALHFQRKVLCCCGCFDHLRGSIA